MMVRPVQIKNWQRFLYKDYLVLAYCPIRAQSATHLQDYQPWQALPDKVGRSVDPTRREGFQKGRRPSHKSLLLSRFRMRQVDNRKAQKCPSPQPAASRGARNSLAYVRVERLRHKRNETSRRDLKLPWGVQSVSTDDSVK
mmetsp:Transcript_2657/g.9648  ORF Transcript_2657/g.9648 Transcript_2657/m.9648 type:complete len:141 (+) Transcript_2657:1327-1749(+)